MRNPDLWIFWIWLTLLLLFALNSFGLMCLVLNAPKCQHEIVVEITHETLVQADKY